MTGAVWLTADTHFRHSLVAELRGFTDPNDHDMEIVDRWNTTIKPDDQVWHLGDVGMGPPALFLPLVEQLHGEIHLVAGNHDQVWPGPGCVGFAAGVAGRPGRHGWRIGSPGGFAPSPGALKWARRCVHTSTFKNADQVCRVAVSCRWTTAPGGGAGGI